MISDTIFSTLDSAMWHIRTLWLRMGLLMPWNDHKICIVDRNRKVKNIIMQFRKGDGYDLIFPFFCQFCEQMEFMPEDRDVEGKLRKFARGRVSIMFIGSYGNLAD